MTTMMNMNMVMIEKITRAMSHIPSGWALRNEAIREVEWDGEQIVRIQFAAASMMRVVTWGEDGFGWAIDTGNGWIVIKEQG